MNFVKAQTISLALNEYNDCAVKAISIACDVPYKVAHQALSKAGRRNRRGAHGSELKAAIKSLGFKQEVIKVDAKTVAKIASDPAVQSGYFLAYVNCHVAAVVNGKVEDWTEGRRHRLKIVFKVTPNASRKQRQQMQKELF